LASGAPPSPFRRPRGIPHRALPWNQSSAFFPRGVRCLSRVLGLRLRPPAPSPSWPLQRRSQTVPEPAGPPLVGFLLPQTPLRRVPLSATRFLSVARVGRELPNSRRCRPQGSCPSRRFWQLAARSRTLRPSPFAVAPDALRSSFIPLASLERPSRAFPSQGAVPALAGRFFLAGSRSTAAGAVARGIFTAAFPVARASSLPVSNPPEGGPGTHEPGRRFLAVASPVASARFRVPHVPSSSHGYWAHRLAAGTPAAKLCSPRESVLRRSQPWPD